MAIVSSDDAGQRQLARTLKTIYLAGKACAVLMGVVFFCDGQWLAGAAVIAIALFGFFLQLRR